MRNERNDTCDGINGFEDYLLRAPHTPLIKGGDSSLKWQDFTKLKRLKSVVIGIDKGKNEVGATGRDFMVQKEKKWSRNNEKLASGAILEHKKPREASKTGKLRTRCDGGFD